MSTVIGVGVGGDDGREYVYVKRGDDEERRFSFVEVAAASRVAREHLKKVMPVHVNQTEEHRSIADMREAIKHLKAAALFLPQDSRARSEVFSLAGQIERVIPHARDALEGKIYTCAGCGITSEYPFGVCAPNVCAECFNKRGVRETEEQKNG